MAGLGFGRLRECLDEDYRLMTAALAAAGPAARVPSCPGWDAAKLGFHLAEVYEYVAEAIRTGREPAEDPPRRETDAVKAVELGYAALVAQFDAHVPADFAPTWYEPDQSVGFWIRRMAHETAVHRIDAQLAAGLLVDTVPDDLAADGIDEFLIAFVGYLGTTWRERETVARLLEAPDTRPVLVQETGGRAWLVTATPGGIDAAGVAGAEAQADGADASGTAPTAAFPAALTVSGPAPEVLAWLWNRTTGSEGVQVSGDPLALAHFGAFRAVFTG
ncbi:MAG TPA: maleylpyruvate isomerase family mycothiol-dependent enzyme [Actinocrinis sp.]|jgi:uncharacterized protein (TIGR03083 family)